MSSELVDKVFKDTKWDGWRALNRANAALRAIPALRQLAAPDYEGVDKDEIDKGEIEVAYEILTEMVPEPDRLPPYDNTGYDAGWESDIRKILNRRARKTLSEPKYVYEQHVALAGEAINLTLKWWGPEEQNRKALVADSAALLVALMYPAEFVAREEPPDFSFALRTLTADSLTKLREWNTELRPQSEVSEKAKRVWANWQKPLTVKTIGGDSYVLEAGWCNPPGNLFKKFAKAYPEWAEYARDNFLTARPVNFNNPEAPCTIANLLDGEKAPVIILTFVYMFEDKVAGKRQRDSGDDEGRQFKTSKSTTLFNHLKPGGS